jgi:hypothetical protein
VEFLLKKNDVNVAFVENKLDESIQKLPKVNGTEPAQTISRDMNNVVLGGFGPEAIRGRIRQRGAFAAWHGAGE